MENTGLNRHKIHRILVAIFCIFIAVCVATVMLNIYDPGRNSLGALASVCMDVICIIILFILIASLLFDSYGTNRTTKLFAILLLASIWAMFMDFLNWAFDGALQFGHLTFWFTLCSLCMGSVLACIFSLYLNRYLEESHGFKRMRKSALICGELNIVSFVLTFILAITGTAFKFVDGHYEIGALYDVVNVIPILTLLYLTIFVIFHVKKIGYHDVVAVAGYILFMIFGALIEAMYRIGTTYVAVAIADVFIFIMLQNEIIAKEKRNVMKWMKKSKTDELTGLNNRQAYEVDLDTLEASVIKDDFVYVSADVNSLKSVNDSLGHNAGDELLVGAAECLKKCLGSYGKLYRIGGDEFIALIRIDEQQLYTVLKDIEVENSKWRGNLVESMSISLGYVLRKEAENMTIREMSVLADKRMYEEKESYYLRNHVERRSGVDRRRR